MLAACVETTENSMFNVLCIFLFLGIEITFTGKEKAFKH